jgi:uncharacterized protein (TIGR03083 family)
MSRTTVDLSTVEPFDRPAAVEFGRVEYHRIVDALERLGPDDWNRATDCDAWTVRDLAGHLAGSMRTQTGIRRTIAELRATKRRTKQTGEREVDAMTAIQIESMADLAPAALIEQMRSLADPAADGRRRPPRLIGTLVKFPVDLGTIRETWTLDYLLGTILTRDTWLHRVADLARATRTVPVLDAAHDGRIVADIAAEWARRHGRPFELTLTGDAGGHFVHGALGPDTPRLELDAIDFCRILSERAAPTHDLLATTVPF